MNAHVGVTQMFSTTASLCPFAFKFACLLILIPQRIDAMTCPCEIHRATAEGPGICSVTDDPESCQIVFDQMSEEHLEKIDQILKQHGFQGESRTLIETMKQQAPADYDMTLITFGLPAAIGLSLVSEHPDRLDGVLGFVADNSDYIHRRFTAEPSEDPGIIKLEDEEAIISHGCFEYHHFPSQLLAMVKTGFSPFAGFCDSRSR
jgi:hypothetical protein